ncbi:MAG: GldG family protein, partial [Pseudomonadota bacterium]
LTDGTKQLLSELNEPLHLRFFVSKNLVTAAPQLAAYASRVEAMLGTYRDLSNGNITLEVINPEPFSDAEDRAVGFGLNRFRLTGGNEELFFGLAATNGTKGQATVPVFAPDREQFLEYDLTRLIAEVGQPQKPVIALIDGLALSGNPMARQPKQQVLARLEELYTVQQISGDVDALPDGTKVLMIVHPKKLSDRTLFTIDQWVLRGGATLVFVDPYAETAPSLRPGMPPPDPKSEFDKLFDAWNVTFDVTQAVGDPTTAIRTMRQIGQRAEPVTSLPWMSLTPQQMADSDALLAQISSLVLTTAGHLTTTSDDVKLTPLFTASPEAGFLPAGVAGDQRQDPRILAMQLTQSDTPLVLAGRLSGAIKTAFPNGKPEKSEAKGTPLKTPDGKLNVILVADADMVMDRNWIRRRNLLGQQIAEAFANNGAFVLNAIEQMAGGIALADLRGRGVSARPFDRINALEKKAEAQFATRQRELTEKLQTTQRQIEQMSQPEGGVDGTGLSEEGIKAVDQFRSELLRTRAELRNVRFDLRRDVDSLKSWLTLVNVGLVPALVAAIALGFAIRRPRKPLPERAAESAIPRSGNEA